MFRQDHWLIAHARAAGQLYADLETASIACGVVWDHKMLFFERQQTNTYEDGSFTPTYAQCPACMATAEYKEACVTIEVGFDGNETAWWRAEQVKLPEVVR